MSKRILVRGAVLAAVLALATTTPRTTSADDPEPEGHKITICHIPPGNPENMHEITVDESAAQAHFEEHGDFAGLCLVG
jgi:hypothetical protein